MILPLRLPTTVALAAFASVAAAQRTPDEALRALQEGNRRFAADRSVPQPAGEGVRRTLARGQSPIAVVVTCADSRVPPEHLFNAGLGELIVVRVAGPVADVDTIATIEQAVEQLQVPLCVVLGHDGCDTIAAAIAQFDGQRADAGRSRAWSELLERIEPSIKKARLRDLGGKPLCDACEEEHAHAVVHECLRRSDLLRRYGSVGKFRIVAARYHQGTGAVEWLPNRPLPPEPEAEPIAPVGAVPMGVPPHVALRLLQGGHRRFLGDGRPAPDLSPARREALQHGQQPFAIVLTCADSRVAPEHVFDAGLGELYVVRTAGNTLGDDALASIEHAAGELGASLLVVMGHSRCDALAAAAGADGQQLTASQRALLQRIEPAVAAARAAHGGHDLEAKAARANALRTLTAARSQSALLRALEEQGRFVVLAGYYDVATGDLEWLPEPTDPVGTATAAAPHAAGDQHPHAEHAHDTAAHAPEPAHRAPGHGDAQTAPDHAHGAAGEHSDSTHAAAHSPPAAHGSATHGSGGHGSGADPHAAPAPNHHGGHDLPMLDWGTPAAPHGETAPRHGHGDDRPAAADGGHGPAPNAADGERHEPAGDAAPLRALFTDPVVLVGMAGILSLLVAAVLAMRGRD